MVPQNLILRKLKMTTLNKSDLDGILYMYNPESKFLRSVNINFPYLEGQGKFPKDTFYINKGIEIKHINNGEILILNNQVSFLLYREAIRKGAEGLPKSEGGELIKNFFDSMFIKRQETRFKKFKNRDEDFTIKVVHKKLKKLNGLYFVWYDISIDGFYDSSMVAGMNLD